MAVKNYLTGKGVAFVQKDPMADPEVLEEMIALGITSAPLTLVDGEAVVGYDPEKLDQLLDA